MDFYHVGKCWIVLLEKATCPRGEISKDFINVDAIVNSAYQSNSLAILFSIPHCREGSLHRFSAYTQTYNVVYVTTMAIMAF